jgi:hypothetical protein
VDSGVFRDPRYTVCAHDDPISPTSLFAPGLQFLSGDLDDGYCGGWLRINRQGTYSYTSYATGKCRNHRNWDVSTGGSAGINHNLHH